MGNRNLLPLGSIGEPVLLEGLSDLPRYEYISKSSWPGPPPDQGKGLWETKEMRRRKSDGQPTVCSQCMEFVNREEAVRAYRTGREYVHECGRVLVRAK